MFFVTPPMLMSYASQFCPLLIPHPSLSVTLTTKAFRIGSHHCIIIVIVNIGACDNEQKPKRLTSSCRKLPSDSKKYDKEKLIFTFTWWGSLERCNGPTAAFSPFIYSFIHLCQCSRVLWWKDWTVFANVCHSVTSGARERGLQVFFLLWVFSFFFLSFFFFGITVHCTSFGIMSCLNQQWKDLPLYSSAKVAIRGEQKQKSLWWRAHMFICYTKKYQKFRCPAGAGEGPGCAVCHRADMLFVCRRFPDWIFSTSSFFFCFLN